VAPGRNIVALMANTNSAVALAHPANVVPDLFPHVGDVHGRADGQWCGGRCCSRMSRTRRPPGQVPAQGNRQKDPVTYVATKAGAGYRTSMPPSRHHDPKCQHSHQRQPSHGQAAPGHLGQRGLEQRRLEFGRLELGRLEFGGLEQRGLE
jgi:hypothetical protein